MKSNDLRISKAYSGIEAHWCWITACLGNYTTKTARSSEIVIISYRQWRVIALWLRNISYSCVFSDILYNSKEEIGYLQELDRILELSVRHAVIIRDTWVKPMWL